MQTQMWTVDKNVDNLKTYPHIIEAAQKLKQNEVVAFPTETVYGLGGNAENDEAVLKIFEAKGRPGDNPLIVHIANREQIHSFVKKIPDQAAVLMDAFWPGPLTIILEKKEGALSEKATAGLSTVAVRMPDHPIALAIIEASGLPLAAPSANLSGKPSPTTANHVADDLTGRISGIVDGGATGVGLESTVVDCTGEIPAILRPGGVTKEQLEEVVGVVTVDPALKDSNQAPKSPGMKYRHYAPNAPFYLVEGTREEIQQLVNEKRMESLKVGVMTTKENLEFYDADIVIPCGERARLETVAEALYDTLRAFNNENLDIIFGEVFPEQGVGQAIMNRLSKASGLPIIEK
ncbi:L-threonylcarbamoyladenylate synthase [Mesobacillus selenatarsenatis]|uniref:Threonylcarbamoyl-AMP synthase n=1 Tax=Mesobacillus selenatarsenatis (strain DSM 18680 / JCM 14380 / FERM P-15431 / SF-1) TaxID=1321606 RepID=A0A0A8WYF5_MESS1|nr:L-threonylcarbamoyladenylate synthase [Mesobacillus selenatarsenatis]GAM12698.1 YrdC/Sua5 family protein, required for threonylcarbamoyladenosine (t(6)A) formation in tRNA [Mesobacillus selenatarsenatis SF-1]